MAKKKEPEKEYPPGYEGYVLWEVDYIRGMKGAGGAENIAYGDPETTAIISDNFEEIARTLEGQLKAIQIVQAMMDEMYAANPSPRMKALHAAIEAIYTA